MPSRRLHVVGATLLAIIVVAGACGKDKNDRTASTNSTAATTTSTAKALPGASRVIDASANNTKQTLVVEEALRINLQTAGGSGFTWKITKQPDPAIVEVESPPTTTPSPTPTTKGGTPIVGAPETVSTSLVGVAPGNTSIELGHIGPTGGAPVDTFKIDITVVNPG